MIEITKDTIIGDILDVAPQTAPIFLSIGMHCLGCPSSRGETVEEACAVHGIDVDKLLADVYKRQGQDLLDGLHELGLVAMLGSDVLQNAGQISIHNSCLLKNCSKIVQNRMGR